jgi:hypothetical protein
MPDGYWLIDCLDLDWRDLVVDLIICCLLPLIKYGYVLLLTPSDHHRAQLDHLRLIIQLHWRLLEHFDRALCDLEDVGPADLSPGKEVAPPLILDGREYLLDAAGLVEGGRILVRESRLLSCVEGVALIGGHRDLLGGAETLQLVKRLLIDQLREGNGPTPLLRTLLRSEDATLVEGACGSEAGGEMVPWLVPHPEVPLQPEDVVRAWQPLVQ